MVVGCWLFAKPVVAQNYTREAPQVTECATCTSSAQFESHAANAVPVNNIRHVMVFNTATQQLNTYFVSKIYERELGFALEEVHPLPTLAEHEVAFDQYLEIAALGQLNDIQLTHPDFKPDTTNIMLYGVWARQNHPHTFWAMVAAAANGKLLPVTLKFGNGWKMKFLINPYSGGAHIFVVLLDQNNNIVLSQNSTTSIGGTGGTGSGGGFITVNVTGKTVRVCTSINGGTPVCYNQPI